ncbi:MAG: sigma factor-like helix-turn-helix DNA-binding protein [Nitrospiraceae bacterium]
MAKDKVRDQVLKDIAKFKECGHLPKAYDVVEVRRGKAYDYWDYVNSRLSGLEPIGNSDMVAVRDGGAAMTEKGKRFAKWLEWEFPTLSEELQEVFTLAFKKGLGYEAVAKVMRLPRRTVARRIAEIRATIAAYVGIVNY